MRASPFLFANYFPDDPPPGLAGQPRPEPPPVVGGFTEEDLEAVRDRAFKQGVETGRREGFDLAQAAARDSAENRQADALEALAAALKEAAAKAGPFQERLEHDAVKVVTSLIGKLAPPLLAVVADAQVDHLVVESLRSAVGQARLEIRLAPAAADAIRPRLATLAAEAGFRGDLELIADPALGPGAARADWGTGTAERDPRAIDRRLSDAVAIAISRLTVRAPGALGASASGLQALPSPTA